MTEQTEDPYRHWNGNEWLRWDGTAWVPEGGQPAASPITGAEPAAATSEPEPEAELQPEPEDSDAATGLGNKYTQSLIKRANVDPTGNLFVGQSKDPGQNSVVILFPDRIERIKPKAWGAISKARQDTEMTPIRSVSGVSSKKDGFKTKVTVYASGNEIHFRIKHSEAIVFSSALQQLILHGSAPTAVPAAPAVDHMAALQQLGALRDAGILTEEEFAAKKAEILGRI